MFGKPITLFKLYGFPIKLDLSWFIIAILVTWSLAVGLFPNLVPELSTTAYWIMGVAGALGLFASVILHELGHAVVARRFGMPIRGITLFIFGGVAELQEEPRSARAEFMVAVAGPIVSVLIALACFGLSALGRFAGWPVAVTGVIGYLGTINAILVIFNIIPAFPLDGGRILRSAIWHWQGQLRRATRITSWIGAGFGFVLMALGVTSFIFGNFIAGIWWFLIGIFLRNAASQSYQQLLVRQALEGEPVRRFMVDNPVTVPPTISVQQLVEDYVYQHYYKLFPVVDDGTLIGCVTIDRIKQVPRNEWDSLTVEAIADSCEAQNTISSEADAMQALTKMSRFNVSRLMVVDDSQLLGIIAMRDLMRFFSTRIDLEENVPEATQPAERAPDEERSRATRGQRHASAER